jgi:hypothetical protein
VSPNSSMRFQAGHGREPWKVARYTEGAVYVPLAVHLQSRRSGSSVNVCLRACARSSGTGLSRVCQGFHECILSPTVSSRPSATVLDFRRRLEIRSQVGPIGEMCEQIRRNRRAHHLSRHTSHHDPYLYLGRLML